MFDTHAHLYENCFSSDFAQVVERARLAGVWGCLVIGERPSDATRIRALQRAYPDWIYPGLGLYPSIFDTEELELFEHLLEEDWYCLGEIGLDTWIAEDNSTKLRQEQIFRQCIQVARQKALPVNVHSRSCTRRALEILLEEGAELVQMHAVDTKIATVKLGLDAGYYFSIPVTVLTSPQKQKLAKYLPLDRLLLETDSPVMAPERGTRNEPANLRLSLEYLAALRALPLTELDQRIDDNVAALYRLSRPQSLASAKEPSNA